MKEHISTYFLGFFTLFLGSTAYSQDSSVFTVNGLNVKVSAASVVNGQTLSIVLAETVELNLGQNSLLAPEGARLALGPNHEISG
ncbi:MAG: hypothetical protein ACRBBP_06975 [Bdellovibrionales bacterium]